ncbi:MAG TPA: peptidoglycan editing factor PgeF [Chloroflexi bacterium]|nr:peptidoglycan editing factor PgeF [Chloroflexota bacterium]HHW86233.1 peptidoglycan editing factor PgeF [Chloroflexota bacterium]
MQRIHHANGVITYTFTTLADQPVAAHVATRHGGVSPAPWQSLNFSILRGDDRARVLENRRRLASALGLSANDFVYCRQVHGTAIAKVSWDDAGACMDGCDGLITDAVDLPLSLVFADCVPLLIYDPTHHVLGIVHAGWRGTVNGAATALLWALQAAYDSDPAQVRVAIGPSIGPQSYEVGPEVVALATARLPHPEALFTYPNGAARNPHFDLWQANVQLLVEAGVPAAQIEVSGIDTAQNTADFFSHRAEQGRCGLFSMVAWLQRRTQ